MTASKEVYELMGLLQRDGASKEELIELLRMLEILLDDEAAFAVFAALIKYGDDKDIAQAALSTFTNIAPAQIPSLAFVLKKMGMENYLKILRQDGWLK